jgi:putative drug exporter of the RND superfamily
MNRLAHWVAGRPRIVIAAWLAVLIAAGCVSLRLDGTIRASTDGIPGSRSQLAIEALHRGFGQDAAFTFPIVIQSTHVSAQDARFSAAIARVERALTGSGHVRSVRHYWNTGAPELLGTDGRSALLLVSPRAGDSREAETRVARIRRDLRAAGTDPEFSAKVTGPVAVFHDLNRHSADDLLAAERVAVPVTLAILVMVFGAPLAAALPLLLALAAVPVSLAALVMLGHWMPVSIFARNAVTMIGLGVGVDYAMLVLGRYRAELAQGRSAEAALVRAVARGAGALVPSGMTVATGFIALMLVPIPGMPSLAIGGAVVVLVAVTATLTLLPAVLSLAGGKIFWPFRPSTPKQRDARCGGLWGRWARFVMRRAWLALLPALAVIAFFAAPVFMLKSWDPGAKDLPPILEARQGADALTSNFGAGWLGLVVLALESERGGSLWDRGSQDAVLAIAHRLSADPRVARVSGYPALLTRPGGLRGAIDSLDELPAPVRAMAGDAITRSGNMALIVLVPREAPESPRTLALIEDLRRDAWPAARTVALTVRIAGASAGMLDFDQALFGALWRVIPAVLLVTYLMLLVQFRSVLIPLKAIALNLLSVLASWGFLVLMFQFGFGAGAIGLEPTGGLNGFIVLMLFTILFGLSMDYEVFLLSRIKEERDRGADNTSAVGRGLQHTGGIITSAALVMVCIFGSFAFTNLAATRQFGMGLAFAVAIDATLIRLVLVPALMQILGERNWWMPRMHGVTGCKRRQSLV